MTTGLPVFDRTLQETNLWLKELEAELGASRQQAYGALRAGFRTLRDRLPAETALNLADQLPLLLRGVYLEGWRFYDKPTGERSIKAFADAIREQLPPDFPADGEKVARAVFHAMRHQMNDMEVDKVLGHLPAPIRELARDAPRPSPPLG